jgi:CII-binding regulator of phage lambda lysogenization HflD
LDVIEDEDIIEDFVIPPELQPFLNKEVNFELFVDMLAEKLDQQRVTLNLKQFQEIEFTQYGIPNLLIEIMMFLSKLSKDQIIEMKIKQLMPHLHQIKRQESEINYHSEQYMAELMKIRFAKINYH